MTERPRKEDSEREAIRKSIPRISGALAWTVLGLAVALRIYGAAAQRFNRNVDCALQSLMARSIAAADRRAVSRRPPRRL